MQILQRAEFSWSNRLKRLRIGSDGPLLLGVGLAGASRIIVIRTRVIRTRVIRAGASISNRNTLYSI